MSRPHRTGGPRPAARTPRTARRAGTPRTARGTVRPTAALTRACLALALLAAAVLATASCSSDGRKSVTLDVLASSELADLGPLLDDLRHDTGVTLHMDYQGTVDASDALTPGHYRHDLAWLSSDRWLRLRLAASGSRTGLPLSTRTMMSPLVIGMRRAAAERLRHASPDGRISWADVAAAAATGSFRYAMADPRHTNSGLSALVGVATAAAGTGAALRPQDVACDRLRGFLTGQAVTGRSTGDLADAYVRHQDGTDALITYESELLALNASGRLREPLEVVYPEDGMVLSDYPLLLLDPAKRPAYDKVVAWLLGEHAQRKLMERTLRRPLDTGIRRDPRLRRPIGNALYFPDQQQVVTRLLADYAADTPKDIPGSAPTGPPPPAAPASQALFLLDFSGSMRGERIAELRAAFDGLSGSDTSHTGRFVRFFRGERITVVRFGSRVLAERTLTYRDEKDLAALRAFVASEDFDGSTAVWSTLDGAYDRVADLLRAGPGRPLSVVLMTDGESNTGIGLDTFLARYRQRPAPVRAVHTYAIRYGDAGTAALDRAAWATGGRMVDARTGSLLDAFQETRGCVQ
ncbi:VWA domain-containing protein [Streptomyces sp. B1866]|uniref:vWA domain-containing protein n=1 Tax=Streptomyces sp. B1866 TaxID=3075431 RepID=UPI00288D9EBA|nr:VWA domain-containing protein [Streptomyces sp. B1866]MDT3400095.1 VWA domain-containing protein [Streptomyces sp. B1866]